MQATNQKVDGVAWGYGPRRRVLDQIFLDAAIEAGAEFRPGFSVEGFMMDGKRVTGIKGHTQDGGNAVIERGHIVIGADGRNSKLARTVQAETYHVEPPLTCFYFTYFSGVENEGFELYARPGNGIFSFMTNDDICSRSYAAA